MDVTTFMACREKHDLTSVRQMEIGVVTSVGDHKAVVARLLLLLYY